MKRGAGPIVNITQTSLKELVFVQKISECRKIFFDFLVLYGSFQHFNLEIPPKSVGASSNLSMNLGLFGGCSVLNGPIWALRIFPKNWKFFEMFSVTYWCGKYPQFRKYKWKTWDFHSRKCYFNYDLWEFSMGPNGAPQIFEIWPFIYERIIIMCYQKS